MQFARKILSYSIILFIVTISACSPSGDTKQSSLPIDIKYENLTTIKLTSMLYVSAFTERLQNGEGKSEFNAYRTDGGKTKQVYNQSFDSAYDARVEVRYDMQYSGQPIVVLRVLYGAIAETLETFGIKNNSLIHLQSLSASGFQWCYQGDSGRTLLVAIPGSAGDQTLYYSWNGARFDQVNPPTTK